MKKCWRDGCENTRKNSKFVRAPIFCHVQKELDMVYVCQSCYDKFGSDMSVIAGLYSARHRRLAGGNKTC